MTIENQEKAVAPAQNSQPLIFNAQLSGSLDRCTIGLLFYIEVILLAQPESDQLSLRSKGVFI
jgi:hypothetical protein